MFSSALKSFTSNISSNYTLSPQPTSHSGPWKIFDAKKKSTGKAASVFVFDKKSLEPQSSGLGGRGSSSALKRAHEEVLERLKKEASSLAKLRHPSILELAEPVEETRNGGLMFATEPVSASLAGLLLDKDEQERAGNRSGRAARYVVEDTDGAGTKQKELEIDELEIQKGLLQISKGLEFLHESAGLVHANLTPEAIFVNAKSDWKISGLSFCGPAENSNKPTSIAPISLAEVLNYDPRLPRSVQINLDYTSPDFVMDNNMSSAADMFSLGMLIIALYRSPHRSPIEANSSISTYKRLFNSSSTVPNQSNNYLSSEALPREVASGLLPKLITRRPAQRLSAKEFQQAPFFDNILVSTIRFLDTLPAKSPNEKSQFMRGLPRVLPQFPKAVLEKKVLPALLEEMKDRELLSLIMQNIFKVIASLPSGRRPFSEKVLPRLREIYLPSTGAKNTVVERDSMKEAGLMIILEKMHVVADNCSGKEFKDDILPIIQHALESPTHSLIDASLKTLPVVLPVLDFSTIKNELFPVIATVFSKTSSMAIKIRGLEALHTLCGGTLHRLRADSDGLDGLNETDNSKSSHVSSSILDRYTIQEKVVPLLKAIKTKEPAVMIAALNVFTEVGKIVDADFLAIEVLPILWQFSLGPLLELQQFQSYMTLIKSLSLRIEQEHTRKLQELSANLSPATQLGDSQTLGKSNSNGFGSNPVSGEVDFESLVLGRKASAPEVDSFDSWDNTRSGSTASVPSQSRTASITQSNVSAAKFAWSTTSPISPKNTAGNTLHPTTATSRTVTPDHTLNSFASLQPSASTSSFSQPLQPSRTGGSISSISNPSRNQSVSTNQSTPIDWSRAAAAVTATNLPLQPRSGWQQNSTLNSLASLAPMQPQNQPPHNAYSMGRGMASNSTTASQSPFSGFGIAPPPSTMNRPATQTQPPPPPPAGQKQGLDKYESLI